MDSIEFSVQLAELNTVAEVSRALSAFGAQFGFDTHAISPIPTEQRPVGEFGFLVQNWPDIWGETYEAEGFGAFDPVPRAASILSHPMTMTDIRAGKAGFSPDPRCRRIFEFGAELGRGCGLLVPIFGPQGYRAIVCFAGPGPDPAPEVQTQLHIAGLYAHNRVQSLVAERVRAMSQLTGREVRILECAGNGLSDEATARELGITARTVRFHFYNARQKLEAANRTEAISKAAAMGLI